MDDHTIIIGGGVVGVSAAYYLASQGRRVTLLEQNEICSGASHGNAGQITPGHAPLNHPGALWRNLGWLLRSSSPLYIPLRFDAQLLSWLWHFQSACQRDRVNNATHVLCELGHASMELFDELADELDFGYHAPGRLEVCQTSKCLQATRAEAELLRSVGFESQTLTPEEVAELEPAVTGKVAGAIYYPRSAYCNPHTLVINLAAAAENLGARIRPETRVINVQVRPSGSRLRLSSGEQLDADFLVLACGAWSPELASQLGLRLPIQPGKGYHVDLELQGLRPKIPTVLVEKRIFASPIDGFLRLAGTMEFSGFNLQLRVKRLEMLSAGAGEYFAGIKQSRIRSRWCHLRPMTPDGLPVIGPMPSAPHVWIAAGHGMLGLTQAPITGKLIAQGIAGEAPSIDLKPLRPDRF